VPHIVIDYTPALRQTAGIGRYTRSLVGALAEADCEHTYTLFCAGERPEAARWPANFRVRVSPLSARWLAIGWQRLRLPVPAELLTGRAALFHSPDFTLPPLAGARGVVTVHDLSFMRLPECADPGLRAYLESALPRAVRRADRILADSLNTRDDLIELLGLPGDSITVVHGGVEPRFHRITDLELLRAVRARYRLPERFILSVGTLEPRKNYPRLIAAYAAVRRSDPALPHRLVIAGKPGWLYEDIYAEVERAGLAEYVTFMGFVADADLPALYTLADLLAFPSLYEGFGLPPLEAMACGTPVVAGCNSSLIETIGDGGLLVDAIDVPALAEALRQALGDNELRASLVTRGLAQAARFTWQSAAQELLTAYAQALA
jgi:glycosyltransferase involved in cell wall biosynthesis